MSGNFAIKGGGVGPLMANAILNFHFDFLTTSLMHSAKADEILSTNQIVKLFYAFNTDTNIGNVLL